MLQLFVSIIFLVVRGISGDSNDLRGVIIHSPGKVYMNNGSIGEGENGDLVLDYADTSVTGGMHVAGLTSVNSLVLKEHADCSNLGDADAGTLVYCLDDSSAATLMFYTGQAWVAMAFAVEDEVVGSYYWTASNDVCPEDDLIVTEEACIAAMDELGLPSGVVNEYSQPGNGVQHTTETGWSGHPAGCFFDDLNGGGLHLAKAAASNPARSTAFCYCYG